MFLSSLLNSWFRDTFTHPWERYLFSPPYYDHGTPITLDDLYDQSLRLMASRPSVLGVYLPLPTHFSKHGIWSPIVWRSSHLGCLIDETQLERLS